MIFVSPKILVGYLAEEGLWESLEVEGRNAVWRDAIDVLQIR